MIEVRVIASGAALLFAAACGQGIAVVPADTTELDQLRAEETLALSSYEAIDAEAGVYQIPIDRAIELVAADARLLEPVVELPDLTVMTPVKRGEYHFQVTYGCMGCHLINGTVKQAPALNKRWGTMSPMESGEQVLFDDAYFTESVLNPRAKLVKGFPPIMPVFADRIAKEDLEDIRAYLKSL